jgi:hypothetical protein
MGPGLLLVLAMLTATLSNSTSFGAEGRNDLVPLLKRSGIQGLCYQRTYGAEHLRREKGQTITSATVLLRPGGELATSDALDLSARLTLRTGSEALYGMASCWWERGGNLLDGGARAEPRIKSDAATRCMSMVEPNSAEEAGDFFLEVDESGKRLLFYNGFSQMRAGSTGARLMRDVKFGRSDEVLRLNRVDRALCSGIEAVLDEPVRAQNR